MAKARQSVFLRRICRWERQSGQKLGVCAAIKGNPRAVADRSVTDDQRFVSKHDATLRRTAVCPHEIEDGSDLHRECLVFGNTRPDWCG